VLAQVSELRSVNPDAIVFLGMGAPTLAMVPAANALGWKVPCFGNIAMLGLARGDAALLREHEGVIWVDQYEPKNRVLQMFEAKYFARHGEKPPALPIATSFWDMTRACCARRT
jgi:ABC-type branched-subunit amino acid transport system substrate-binding protein